MDKNLQDIDLYKSIFKASVQAILVINTEGVIVKANLACEQLFGYQQGELINKIVTSIISEEFKGDDKPHQKVYITKPIVKDLELSGIKKDGTKFPLNLNISPTEIAGKKVIITFIEDLTAKKIIEKKLKISKTKLKTFSTKIEKKVITKTNELTTIVQKLVASNLGLEDQIQETKNAKKSAIASKNLSSAIAKNFPNGFIIVFNSNYKMLLIEGEAIIPLGLNNLIYEGTTVDDISILSEGKKSKLKQDILKTIAGEHLGFEITYLKKYFSVNTISLLDNKGVISSALFVYSDITAQKKIEKNVQNALKKEQELNELKSRFISMASHEFRTPLSAILTSAILIGKQNDIGKEEKRERHVDKIKKNVKQLVVILNDFLSLSKLEEGQITAHKKLFDFVSLTQAIIEEVSITKKTGQKIFFSSPDHPISINLDPKLVRHVLMNLLSNAIKYSAKKTAINIKVEESDQFVSLEIKDQGIGIPEAEQDKLFQRFFRAENANNIEGTGLGLNIVKQYITLMDGTINFKSKVNTGTTFLVKLPKPTK